MTRVVCILIAMIAAPRLSAQSEINVELSGPKFDVASIKPSRNLEEVIQAGLKPHVGITIDAARVDIGYWSLLQLIVRAYGIQPYQLVAPDWTAASRFDVQATLPPGASEKRLPGMLQWLLSERFGLIAHADKRDLPGYTLRLGKGGVKMKPAPPEPGPSGMEEGVNSLDLLWGGGESKPFGLTDFHRSPNGDFHMQFEKMPIPVLAQILTSYLRAPVADLTGLAGKYQATLDFSPAPGPAANASLDGQAFGGNDLFTAVKALGLKLERDRVRCPVLVVDHIERTPAVN
jgi:uncharacterized protein (TIGR03435 family)